MTDAATAAAKWWGSILRRAPVVHDNGDPTQSMMMTALQPPGAHDHDPETVDQFETLLAEAIDQELTRLEGRLFTFGVDYGPDPILADTFTRSGLGTASMFTFPAKTTMHVWADKVETKEGYGKQYATVWEAPNS